MRIAVFKGVKTEIMAARIGLKLIDRGFPLVAVVCSGKTWRVTGQEVPK